MNLWWIPKRVEDFYQDLVCASFQLWFGISEGRRHSSFKKTNTILLNKMRPSGYLYSSKSWGHCRHCTKLGRLEVHHVIPLWVLSMETVIHKIQVIDRPDVLVNKFLRDQGCGKEAYSLYPDESIFPLWNVANNLVPLCPECHTRAESKADTYFKRRLQEQYAPRLHWNSAAAERAYKKHLRGARGK